MANDENLEKGKATQFGNPIAAREAQKKSAASRKRNNTLRKLGRLMLTTPIDVSAEQLAALKRLGFEDDKPEVQMVLLGQLAAIALSNDPKLAMQATDKLLEITGNDVFTLNADENRKIKRAELRLKQEKAARDNWE